jgi:hypothetical protein
MNGLKKRGRSVAVGMRDRFLFQGAGTGEEHQPPVAGLEAGQTVRAEQNLVFNFS